MINPNNVEQVFKNMKPLPVGFLRLYLILIASPLFLGYYLYYANFQLITWSTETSFKVALRYYLLGVLTPMVMGYLLYLFDQRLLKQKIPHDEALTLMCYALTPAILSGVFRVSANTWILHLILMMYSVYLLYCGLETRYGEEKNVLLPFLFLMFSGIVFFLITLMILTTVLGIPPEYY